MMKLALALVLWAILAIPAAKAFDVNCTDDACMTSDLDNITCVNDVCTVTPP